MKYKTLNQTDISVSTVCLGTMTYGMQNTIAEAFQQMDYAIDMGVNFLDTAELYSVPAMDIKTFGETERHIGSWLKARNNRDKIVIATKVLGPTSIVSRPNPHPLTPETIFQAVNNSLDRLNTDYIDLYQVHWPLRPTNYFGQLGYIHSPDSIDVNAHILSTIETMNTLIKQGKIRHYGISNETAWGAMKYNAIAKQHNLLPPITIQNPYNLLNRSYEVGLSEVSMRENMGLLAYSPLGGGTLSGKHLNGIAENTRISLYPEYFGRYTNTQSVKATQAYAELASNIGLTLTELALAFINQQPFITSNIIGATKMDQLKQCIDSVNVQLSSEILEEIEKIHTIYPYPAP